ncbi:MAG: hypothetical protein N3A67_04630 [Ignavibacteria bacterium]|nr:hypothetical protein [Ignavibacteria bacterium]
MKWYLLILLCFLYSCGIFETRSPEEPDQSPVVFLPATSPEVLMQNFLNSVRYKRLQNYSDCFIGNGKYNFIPAQDAFATYQSIFQNWTIAEEQRSFKSIISAASGDNTISLNFEKSQYQYTSPDSIIFAANYEIHLPTVQPLNLEKYNGRMLLTISQAIDGTYKIVRWSDFQTSNDTIYPSWSILKARYYN